MTFSVRAAIVAATTLCIAAGIGATAPTMAQVSNSPAGINDPNLAQVPTMAEALADLEQVAPADTVTTADAGDMDYATLADAVAAQSMGTDDEELNCLAAGVYYESKGEPLEGQLAVAEVILNRSLSGRFARTVCGVLKQRGQFSFVRGGSIPQPPASSKAWKTALGVAKVARADKWDSRFSEALYFHATHVSPGWRRARVGSVGNHVFYR